MKLSKTEIRALSQKFLEELKAKDCTISFPKWKSSIKGQEAKKLLDTFAKLQKEQNEIMSILEKKFNSRFGRDLKTIYNNSTKSNVPSHYDIENEIIVSNIDLKSVDELMKKLEAKFKTK